MPTADLSFLALAVAVVAVWEFVAPRRSPGSDLRLRWLRNLAVWAMGLTLVRLLFPVLGVGVALFAAERGVGLLNILPVPAPVGLAAAILILDFAKYLEHLSFHWFAVLWRIHRMHHTDQDFDFTLGFRFHPAEALLSTAWTFAVIALLGLPAAGVAIWQAAVLANAVFAHGNVRMPHALDRVIRLVTVTPDLHRVHHSAVWRESGSNLGSLFPWWDRLLGTYVAAPEAGLEAMPIGLEEFRDRKYLTLPGMLLHPLRPLTDAASGRGDASAPTVSRASRS